MSFPRYECYKDSGVEWLGQVPEHWEILPLKRSFDVVGGSTPASEAEECWGGEIVWVTPVDLSKESKRFIERSERTITREGLNSCSASLVPAGSIVLSTRAPIGSLAITATTLCTNQGCKSLLPRPSINSNFYLYLLSSITEELQIRGKGTTFQELSTETLGAVKLPKSPLEEQQHIAKFLDHETAKVDVLIEKQHELIALLQERRQAVISQAVTKGLDPTIPMKDSAVEWLGKVPEHWRVKRLRFCAKINPSRAELGDLAGDTPVSFFPMESIAEAVAPLSANERRLEEVETGYSFFRENDVAIARITPCFENGKRALFRKLTNGIGFGTTELIVLRACADESAPEFLYWLCATSQFMRLAEGSMYGTGGQKRVSEAFVRNYRAAIPSISEQLDIASFLDQETAKIDALIEQQQRLITLLQERRSALVSAAVTGKIDVRNYTAVISAASEELYDAA